MQTSIILSASCSSLVSLSQVSNGALYRAGVCRVEVLPRDVNNRVLKPGQSKPKSQYSWWEFVEILHS